jgi:hypothetical protein
VGAQTNRALVARVLVISGVATIVVAVVLGIVVEPVLFAIAGVGILDLVLARAFASGRLGSADGDAAEPAPSEDPSYNPYARED